MLFGFLSFSPSCSMDIFSFSSDLENKKFFLESGGIFYVLMTEATAMPHKELDGFRLY